MSLPRALLVVTASKTELRGCKNLRAATSEYEVSIVRPELTVIIHVPRLGTGANGRLEQA